jgi:hypothetical protein
MLLGSKTPLLEQIEWKAATTKTKTKKAEKNINRRSAMLYKVSERHFLYPISNQCKGSRSALDRNFENVNVPKILNKR